MFIKGEQKQWKNCHFSISCLWYLVFCILTCSLYYFKFQAPSQNFEFHIHQNCKEIGLSEVTKCCAKKIVKRTLFLSLCKMVIFFSECFGQLFPNYVSCMGRDIP